jgi:hypothetical protein
MADITFAIIKHIGVINTSPKGWTTEVNLISWNGATPKLDIRDWAPDHAKMGKGITLTESEAKELAKALRRKR